MTVLNLNDFSKNVEKYRFFVQNIIQVNGDDIRIKDIIKDNTLDMKSKNEIFDETLNQINNKFKTLFSIGEFSYLPEKLKEKSNSFILAEGFQWEKRFWKFSNHKSISYWWVLSDGTVIGLNESEKYGISYVSKKFSQFKINGEIFNFSEL